MVGFLRITRKFCVLGKKSLLAFLQTMKFSTLQALFQVSGLKINGARGLKHSRVFPALGLGTSGRFKGR